MTNQQGTHPALEFLKRNGAALGIATVLAVSVGTFVVNAAQPPATARPAPRPSVVSTATLDDAVTSATATPGAPTATAAPSAGSGSSGAQQAGGGSAGAFTGGTAAGTAAAPVPTSTVVLGAHDQAPKAQDWEPVAEAFTRAFVDPSVGKDKWLAAIQPYITPALYEQYKIADITRIPQDELKYVTELRHSERAYVFVPRFASGKDRFTATADIQDSTGAWLVGHVGAPE